MTSDKKKRKVSWQENAVVLGESMSSNTQHAANEFEILSFIENGLGSKIYEVVQKQRNRKYTMEVVARSASVETEANSSILHKHTQNTCSYLAQLKYSFQTKNRKYFVLSHLDNKKSLIALINNKTMLNENESRFIITEIIVAIESLHKQGIPYGNLTIDDIFLDTKGHVLLKRIYNCQTYWAKHECYECHKGNCKNVYHNNEKLSEHEKTRDWNRVGQLLVHIITGKQMFCSAVDKTASEHLSKEGRDFARMLLEDKIDVTQIKKHKLLKNTDWQRVRSKVESEVPDSIKLFVLSLNYKHLKDTTFNETMNGDACTESDDENGESTPRTLIEGVRKQRTKSDVSSSRRTTKEKRRRSISQKSPRKEENSEEKYSCDTRELNDILSNTILMTQQAESNKQTLQRKKSIEVYQKRLQEISSVLDKNRSIMQSIDPNKSSIDSKDTSKLNKNTVDTISNTKARNSKIENSENDKESLVKKIYSENDAIRTILSKYGLLKEENTQEGTSDNNRESKDTNNNKFESILKSTKPEVRERKLSRNKKSTAPEPTSDITSTQIKPIESKRKSKSRKSSQSKIEETPTESKIEERPTESKIEERPTEELLGEVFISINEINTTATYSDEKKSETSTLIERLNGLNKSRTFSSRRNDSTPSSPHMKRHVSDPTQKPSTNASSHKRKSSIPDGNEKNFSPPQSLLKTLQNASPRQSEEQFASYRKKVNKVFVKEKSISCDSGLNEPIDEERKNEDNKKHVERNDSGIGKDVSGDSKVEEIRVWKPADPDFTLLHQTESQHTTGQDCFDCGKENIEEIFPNNLDTLCKRCGKSRIERKQAVTELIETEINFGEDLRILKEEFYAPLKKNSICSTDEISRMFLNLQELVDVNAKLCLSLQYGLEQCLDQNDAMNLSVGEIFLSNMEFFEAYELYCSKHNEALELLTTLQKKSDVLRIFLTVSSQENSKLRKMDLKSFLTMPVQRIMKYPLLLSRILKHTPEKNEDRKKMKEALLKIEDQIAKINSISKGSNNIQTPRISKSNSFSSMMDVDSTDVTNVTKMVANLQDWKLEETKVLLIEDFEIFQNDLVGLTCWDKSTFKKIIYLRAVLCVKNAPDNYEEQLAEHLQNDQKKYVGREIKDGSLVLLKQKYMDKCMIYKRPIKLKDCIISVNEEIPIAFELTDNNANNKEPLTFVARNISTVREWRNSIQFVINSFHQRWRQRRGGRSNIMISDESLIQS